MEMDSEDGGTSAPVRINASLHVANDVVQSIAVMAALEDQDVTGLATGLVGGIGERLGRRIIAPGVRTEVRDGRVRVELFLIVGVGRRIPEVAQRVQNRVKATVEHMTGLKVAGVDIHIQGVSVDSGNPSRPGDRRGNSHGAPSRAGNGA